MNTPSITLIFKLISEWVAKHKVLLGVIWCLCVAAVSQFVKASDFETFKLETIVFQQSTSVSLVKAFKEIDRQKNESELDNIREDIEDYKRFPDYKEQEWITDRLERLDRRQVVLEKKISS